MTGRVSETVAQQWLEDFDNVYVSLHFSDPDVDDPVLSELSGGGYRRIPCTMQAVSSRAVVNTEPIRFTGLPSALAAYVGIWSDSVRGTLMASSQLASPQRLIGDSTYIIPEGSLAVSIA